MSEEIECLFKNLDGILSFTYRSNPPTNLFWLYLKILKPVILNCAFGKVKCNFLSNKIVNDLCCHFKFISYTIDIQMSNDKIFIIFSSLQFERGENTIIL